MLIFKVTSPLSFEVDLKQSESCIPSEDLVYAIQKFKDALANYHIYINDSAFPFEEARGHIFKISDKDIMNIDKEYINKELNY